MPSTAAPPPDAAPGAGVARTVAYDDFVDDRIAKTRAAVKATDVATSVVVLLAWCLLLLLIAAVAEHWFVTGGFSPAQRFGLFAVGLIGAGAYAARRVIPPLLKRVNPLYAAREIERDTPEIKNSLVNLLQLRERPAQNGAVRQALEQQAAERLASSGDAPIDRTPLLRAAQVLLALVAAIGAYVVASPKDFFATAGRVLAPWAEITPPTRVRIDEVEPGDTTVPQGERVTVTAMVEGLREDERVELVYSTTDGRVIDRRVPMRPSATGLQHSVTLPAGSGTTAALGLQNEITYRLAAGDARSRPYRIEVLTAPTIAPVSVRYEYPRYTGYSPREVEGVGDLRAIEGTRVTIQTEANLPIESAQIDLGADGRTDARMRVDEQTAIGSLTLRRPPGVTGDATTNYVIRFTSTDGQANHNPPTYRVEVIADLAPEAALVEPEAAERDVAVDERVTIIAEARDPDFALSSVRLVGQSNGREVLGVELDRGQGRERVVSRRQLVPAEIGLRPGDVLEYWVVAADNRSPEPNRVESERQRLRIVGPSAVRRGDATDSPEQTGEAGAEQGSDGADGRQGSEQGEPNPGQRGESGGQSERQENGEEQPRGENETESSETSPTDEASSPESEEGEGSPPAGPTGPGGDSQSSPSDQEIDGQASPDDSGSADSESSQQGESGQPRSGEQNGSDRSSTPSGASGENGGAPSEGERESPVARDGTDDGQAFRRIQEFLEQQEQTNRSGESREGGDERSQQDPKDREGDGVTGDTRPGQDGQASADEPSDSNDAAEDSSSADGNRGDARDGSDNSDQRSRDGDAGADPERPDSPPGDETGRSGESSDSQSSDTGGESPPGEPDERADSPRDGAASSGQNQASDQGAGQSNDRGPGDSTDRAGGEQQSDSPTGRSGDQQAGDGSQSRSSDDPANSDDTDSVSAEQGAEQNERAGDRSGQPSDGRRETGDNPTSDGRRSSEEPAPGSTGSPSDDALPRENSPNGQDDRAENSGDSSGEPGKPQGLVERGDNSAEGGAGSEAGGDAANLDYARKQTELVLEQLADQLRDREVDRKLLDKLGWTEEDLRRFVERWQGRKQRAAQRGAEGEAALDRALRSLGLGAKGPTARSRVQDDELRDLRERARTATPPQFRDALQRFNRSVGQAADE